jgi:outer membrane protein TolC
MTDTDTLGEFQGGAIQQEIVTAGKRRLSRQKYLARARTAEWMAVAQQWKVCNDVRIHFWRTLGHRQIVDIRKELLKHAEDDAVTARERYNLGQATRAELHMSNVALQRARLALLNAENLYRSQFGRLTSLAGVELSPQPLAGDLERDSEELIDFDAALSRMYEESPEILAARAKWQADSITVQRERVEPIPNVFVQVGSGYNFESREPVASAQVFFDVPIFDRNQGTIRQAEADLRRQSAEIRRTELRLRDQLSQTYQDYLTALQHVTEFQAVILPEARSAYANQLDAYKEDRQNWGDVLRSQREYFDLREQYVQNLILWRTNEALINGFLLHGGLDAAPSPTPPGHIDAVAQPR